MIPTVVIIGKPNAGKSTLYNRLTGTRDAIVDDMPGVTRDAKAGEVSLGDRAFNIIDTGGFFPDDPGLIPTLIKEKAFDEVNDADAIIFLMDAREGVTSAEKEIAKILRATGKTIIAVGNKADDPQKNYQKNDIFSLGFEDTVFISAEHIINIDTLLERIVSKIPEAKIQKKSLSASTITIVGKPNVGKSTFMNALLKESRVLVSEIPGTTRDVIDVEFNYKKHNFILLDTAGIRDKAKIYSPAEIYSVLKARATIERADVTLFMIDCTLPFTHQDRAISRLIDERARGVIILLNKWDLVPDQHDNFDRIIENLHKNISLLDYAPAITVSAKDGTRIFKVMDKVMELLNVQNKKISTGPLNRALRTYYNERHPAAAGRGYIKLNYIIQTFSKPCKLMIFTNRPNEIEDSYKKYLARRLREDFHFEGLPIRIEFRKK
jgi:GTP-binding protein